MNARVEVPYGESTVPLSVPEEALLGVFGLPRSEGPRHPDALAGLISEALDHPVGLPPLAEHARGKQTAVIICDDVTRPTPGALILPQIVARLNRAGLRDQDISILFALGTHRGMTEAEMEAKVGPEMARRLAMHNHSPYDKAQLVDLGVTPTGVPVSVNRRVVEADLVIGVGSIVPHRYCGWSGGAKIVQPGVSSEATTLATHLLVAKVPDVVIGAADNTVRREMEEVARRAGLSFIVNTVLDASGVPAAVVAGDFIAAHRQGVELAKKVCGVHLPQLADVVVTSSHPCDINFWQAGKSFYSAECAVKPGGAIILVSPLFEGIGEHVEFAELIGRSEAEITRAVDAGEVHDVLSAAAAFIMKIVMARATVHVVTDGLSESQLAAMAVACHPVSELQSLVDKSLATAGPGAKLVVFPEGPEVLPLVAE